MAMRSSSGNGANLPTHSTVLQTEFRLKVVLLGYREDLLNPARHRHCILPLMSIALAPHGYATIDIATGKLHEFAELAVKLRWRWIEVIPDESFESDLSGTMPTTRVASSTSATSGSTRSSTGSKLRASYGPTQLAGVPAANWGDWRDRLRDRYET
jgi:hypothetical protein